ncbi:SRPBCC family protein [Marinitenerispora sediminis]|uniref:Coenzyme Q-binding protein COQ10 START domain-containing protein n=1 Tax=Marinitenerispora sediminis TaxID=1931232 RepID=A0A368T2C6_9ACTN|nr:SRPBCC family protein [Marinitenerispora sediminis]RCV50087.1 hypothetical protein DEF23_22625 [Marinitenerispora sediminis]RCV55506.1 hypothetical protein DEF24_17885 [Marinitenerispora sediminis]RCV57616.1 hypothetical protein DEF28_01485 [Marinitenerispora sediminis]
MTDPTATDAPDHTAGYERVRAALIAMDIDPARIRPGTLLRADLDVDSTELVEIAAAVMAGTGRRVHGRTLKGAQTVADLARLLDREAADPPTVPIGITATRTGEDRPVIHTEHATTIDAPVETVWEVVCDVEGYARLFPATLESEIVEEGADYQVVRRVVDVGGQVQAWVSRREIDAANRVVAYHQIDRAPLVDHMGGEWRVYPLRGGRTQLVVTHDYVIRAPEDGLIAGKFTEEEAAELLRTGIERSGVEDLAAMRGEAERRHRLAPAG